MGCYVNPKDEKKEVWLNNNAELICDVSSVNTLPAYETLCTDNCLPIILVDNGAFYAAGVGFDKREYQDFTMPYDPRPRRIYKCKKELLKGVIDDTSYLDRG